jgi:hypothetical protein
VDGRAVAADLDGVHRVQAADRLDVRVNQRRTDRATGGHSLDLSPGAIGDDSALRDEDDLVGLRQVMGGE